MARWLMFVVAVGLLGGCTGGPGWPISGQQPQAARQRQASDVLARYDQAVREAGGPPGFVPVGDLTGQIGDWEPATAETNRRALSYGDPFEVPVDSATTTLSSRQLTVTFEGGSCGEQSYTPETFESASAVVVIVVQPPWTGNCAGVGVYGTTTANLSRPLGERAVLNVFTGQPVPATVTG
jgi:hypothetical protein